MKSWIIFILFASTSYALNPNKMKLSKDNGYIDVTIRTYQNFHLSDNCFKSSGPKCDSFEATKKKIERTISKNQSVGHPAARYCHDKNGVVRILIDENKKQYDYCLFNDGSMIDSWDLYYEHFPKKEIE